MSKNKKASSARNSSKKTATKAGGAGKKQAAKKTAPKKAAKAPVKKKVPAKKAAPKKVVKAAKTKPKAAPKVALKKSAKPAKKISAKPEKKSGKELKSKVASKAPTKEIKKDKKLASAPVKNTAPAKKIESRQVIKDGKEAKALKVDRNEKILETVHKPGTDGKAKGQDVLAITNTIPKQTVNTISPSKIASISSSITNPVRRTESYSVKPEKEPAGKYELEFVVRSSPEMLYEFLSTPSGLSEWFCDDVNIRNGIYTFIWDGQLQQARLLKTVDDQLVRFQWVDKTDGSYFEFRIQRDDLTNDISLIITDFAESVGDRESAKLLWQSQVEKLLHVIGSIF